MSRYTIYIVGALTCGMSHALAQTRSESVQETVPKGMYIRELKGHPPCGVVKSPLANADNPKFVAATGTVFGPHAAAAVVLAAETDKTLESHGGELAKFWKKSIGQKEVASCVVMCVRAPKGVKVTRVDLSNGHGVINMSVRLPYNHGSLKPGAIGLKDDGESGDFSGWRDVIATHAQGRTTVCGTATNWNDAEPARKVMSLRF